MTPRAGFLVVMLPTLLLASVARASPNLPDGESFLSIGPLFSISSRQDETGPNLGLEATLNRVEGSSALGVFGQALLMGDGHTRLCGGVQATYMLLGLELGVLHETGTRSHVATTGLHVAPYLAFILGSVGVRFGLPLTGPGPAVPGGQRRPRYGAEAGLVLTLQVPLSLTRGVLKSLF